MYTLPCPKSVCSSQHCLEGGRGVQFAVSKWLEKCIWCYICIFDMLRIWKEDFSITVPMIFVLHCLNNIRWYQERMVVYENWKEFFSQKLVHQYSLFPFSKEGYGRYLIVCPFWKRVAGGGRLGNKLGDNALCLPSLRKNWERRRLWIAVVNHVPVYICINYFFVLSLTVKKAHVGRKIALASLHRLAEHLHAMTTQKSRYKNSDYSQARSSVPSKIPLMYLLFERWTVSRYRFQIHLCVHSCMRNKPWIHTRFSYEISTSSVSLNLM